MKFDMRVAVVGVLPAVRRCADDAIEMSACKWTGLANVWLTQTQSSTMNCNAHINESQRGFNELMPAGNGWKVGLFLFAHLCAYNAFHPLADVLLAGKAS
ncbi:hypothetical protein RY831_01600 [Noviherbaspirillum sp. CPCC 100848]|uniref:Secreted protein n=1 Tax=Noviherbaspirillum album TaxID=3080276 RepID=A0ABU6J2I5_9BURK|nr:hypothetical protein [Noviherbaspirillum sp. CPCC 100848]MEC4717832.1 hypothetical protein [Noviherbaspirillum sp. CPCC 100848]